jgi:hypothetical protein
MFEQDPNNTNELDGSPGANIDDASNASHVEDASFQPDIFDPRYWNSLDSEPVDILAHKRPKRDLSILKGHKDRFSRRFSALFYTRILSNGEECDRDWKKVYLILFPCICRTSKFDFECVLYINLKSRWS